MEKVTDTIRVNLFREDFTRKRGERKGRFKSQGVRFFNFSSFFLPSVSSVKLRALRVRFFLSVFARGIGK